MAAQDALERQPETLQRTVFAESLKGILGAGRRETAGRWLEWRNAQLIELYQQYERCGKNCLYFHFPGFPEIFSAD